MNFQNINRDNYEIYIVDYYDGNLSDVLKVELFAFLEANPDLKQEFESFRIIPVKPESLEYSFKKALKKDEKVLPPLTEQKVNELLIARLEGDISAEENIQLTAYTRLHPEVEKDAILYQHTIVQPDNNIVYPDKENLKHEGRIVPFYYRSVAASVALFILFYWIFIPKNISNNNTVAVNEKTKSATENNQTELVLDTNNNADATVKEEKLIAEKTPVQLAKNNSAEKKTTLKRKEAKQPVNNNNNLVEEDPIQIENTNTPQELLTQVEEHVKETIENDGFNNPVVIKAESTPVAMATGDKEKDFLNIDELVAARIREKELAKTVGTPNKKIEKGDMISLGGKIWQKITGRNVNMKKQYDENGELYAYYIKTGSFEISKTGNK